MDAHRAHLRRRQRCARTLEEAFTSDFTGLKVIIAEGECQLERQRRVKPWIASLLKRGKRVVRVKYGVDEDVCNGDHACIRLSGCPTLTLKDNPDPLKVDPVATVIDGCVGCGLCGENAHAATLCPSFYRAEVVRNPKRHERLLAALRAAAARMLLSRDPVAILKETIDASHRTFCGCCCAIATARAVALRAVAQDWPAKPVRADRQLPAGRRGRRAGPRARAGPVRSR